MGKAFALVMTLRHKFRSMWNTLFAHLYVRHYCHLPRRLRQVSRKMGEGPLISSFSWPPLTPLLSKTSQCAMNEASWKPPEVIGPQATAVFGLSLERACEAQERQYLRFGRELGEQRCHFLRGGASEVPLRCLGENLSSGHKNLLSKFNHISKIFFFHHSYCL